MIYSSKTSSPSVLCDILKMLYNIFEDVMYILFLNRILYNSVIQPLLTLRRLMSYIYGAPILDVSRSHTTTQHSR